MDYRLRGVSRRSWRESGSFRGNLVFVLDKLWGLQKLLLIERCKRESETRRICVVVGREPYF